jgi:hypothetical protein
MEEIRTWRNRIGELLERHMTAEGYSQKGKSKHTHILDSFVYSYINAAGNSDNIKVEINYSLPSHVLPAIDVTVAAFVFFSPLPVRILAPVEIFAGKIVALANRAAPRDLYDLNNMVCYGLFDEPDIELLRKCAVFYWAIAGDVTLRGFNFKRIESITPYKIRTDLDPMIRGRERFDLQSVQKRVSSFLNEKMALTGKEAAFLERFSEGHYEPELLFNDDEILKRVESHPMAIWRIRHILEGRQPER